MNTTPRPPRRRLRLLGLLLAGALIGAGVWQLRSGHDVPQTPSPATGPAGGGLKIFVSRPNVIPGSKVELWAVAGREQESQAQGALQRAKDALADTLKQADMSGFNQAKAGQLVELSPGTMELLAMAKQWTQKTRGAVDATARPIQLAWRTAASAGRMPSEQELGAALAKTGWDKIELLPNGARKTVDGVEVDLGDLAKKRGIDGAVAALRDAGCAGGMVDIDQQDTRVFGLHGMGDKWLMEIPNPFTLKPLGTVNLTDAALCTRATRNEKWRIGNAEVSRVIDPRTAKPAGATACVAVVTGEAVDGLWASALSVLGPSGIDQLPKEGLPAAMVLSGSEARPAIVTTPGFDKFLAARASETSTGPASGPAAASGPSTAPTTQLRD